jgi:hypothetical protein
MQALLVTLLELLFFNYKCSAGGGELSLPGSQGKQASHLRGVGATEISICKSSTTLPTSGSGRSKGEWDNLSHYSFSSSGDALIKGETSVKVTNFPLFLFLDGNQALRIQEGSPLACLLKHWKDLDPESLQQK